MKTIQGGCNPDRINGKDVRIIGYVVHAKTAEGDCEAYWGRGGGGICFEPYGLEEIMAWMARNKASYESETRWRLRVAKVTVTIEHNHEPRTAPNPSDQRAGASPAPSESRC